jgi:hypothetical protein
MRLIMVTVLLLPMLQSGAQSLLKLTAKVKSPGAITYSPDNKYLIVAAGREVHLFSPGSETKVTEFSGAATKQGHTKDILSVTCSSDNLLLATTSADHTIRLWKLPSGEPAGVLTGHIGPVSQSRFLGNDKYLVSISDDLTVRLWDLATQKEVYTKRDHIKAIRALDVSPDGKWIATAGGDKDILLRDAQTGEVSKRLKAHTDWVRTLAFSPDGKILASAGDDKNIFLWDMQSDKPIKTFPQRGWTYDLKFSGDARYMAAALEKYSVDVYDVQTGFVALKLSDFKNPVRAIAFSPNGKEISSIEEVEPVIKYWNIETLNISPVFRFKDKKDSNPPQIFVGNPPNLQNNRVTIYKDLIDLRGSVVDESGVRQLKVNGVNTPIRENGNFVINLPLAMGDNLITMEVTDINDNIALKKFVIVRKDMGGQEYNPASAKNYLMVVGINNYQHWPKLNNAIKDASDVASTLISKYNFEFDNIIMLKDEQATRSNIYNSLRGLIEKITPQDNLLVYYSGHGYFDQLLNEGYWVPVEAHTSSNGDYISNTEILKIINNINSQHTFLVADACFSGSLFSEATRGYSENVEKFKSRWGLVSGRLEVVSDGALGDNSPFAKNFISFLKQNDKSKFAASELIQYVKMKVAETSQQTPLGNPLKNAGDEGGEFIFYKKQ